MTTATASKPGVIWLTWQDKLDLRGSQHRIVFSPVRHKEEARGDEKERLQDLLKHYEAELKRSEPGYTWSIKAHQARPILKFIIRGDRTI